MKGTSFQKGIEIKVETQGESWRQGDTLQGTLTSKLREGQKLPSPVHLQLALGHEKKVKAKAPDAFSEYQDATITLENEKFQIQLPLHAEISDKASSLYLLYGFLNTLEPFQLDSGFAHLKLTLTPHPLLQDILDLLSTHYRFVLKSIQTGIKAKLAPPTTKDWAALEQLLVELKLKESSIEVIFEFSRNEVEALSSSLKTKLVKRKITRQWDIKKFIHDFNQRLDKEITTEAIDQIIEEYRNSGWLS